jgi:hypothetical protein
MGIFKKNKKNLDMSFTAQIGCVVALSPLQYLTKSGNENNSKGQLWVTSLFFAKKYPQHYLV